MNARRSNAPQIMIDDSFFCTVWQMYVTLSAILPSIFVLMNKFTLFFSGLTLMSLSLLLSCGEAPYQGEIFFSEVAKVGATEKTIAQLEITGMMCEVGCVAKVKKELLAQAGVSNVKIDFEKGREFNFASIEYDPLNCDAKSLSSVVNAIADGKLYGVKSVEVSHFAPAAASSLE